MFNGDRSAKYPNEQDMVHEGIPFINAGDLENGCVNLLNANKITTEKYNDLGGAKLQLGDIVYCLRGTLGKNAYIDNFSEGTVASSLVAIRPKNIDGKYLFYILNSDIEYSQRILHDEGAAQPNLSAKSVSEFIIPIPNIDEQKKLSSFFDSLSNLITLHQRKYDKLQVLKKAMLEKMFPKNGSSVPEIRFKGFTDAWEQRKLGELLKTITTGKSVNSDDGAVAVGDIGILKTSCVSYDRFNPYESKPVVKDELQSVKCAVEKDSVIVSRMNTPERVGACGYVSTDFPNLFLPDRLWKLKFQDNVDAYFVYMMLVSSVYKEKITSMASGTSGSMYNIPKETFLNLQLVVPVQTSEQRKIGQVLRQLNDFITLHQRELEKLQNIKKSMLEKMFV